MNEMNIEKANAKFKNLLETCEKLSSKMWNENKKRECFFLEMMCMRMSEIRYEIRLAEGFLNLWGRVGNAEYESDFKRLANYCFHTLIVELNLDIIRAELCGGSHRFMELFSDLRKLCKFYQSYYALKFAYARNNEI